jgi:phosphopantothenate-cysteine ligase
MSRILITGGPTNEYIDEVMKITNMSTGTLSVTLAEYFLCHGDQVCLVLNHHVNVDNLITMPHAGENLKFHWVETTDEMLKALKRESSNPYDAVIHAAAVGDYKAEFSFLMEDMAKELYDASRKSGGFQSAEEIFKILTNPKCKLDDSSKISSYQTNLTVKLGLTPKIIANLREWYPDARIIGCKLLDNVSKEELYAVAAKLCEKNNMDYILANDLTDLRNGIPARYLVTKEGYTGTKLETPKNIYKFICELMG